MTIKNKYLILGILLIICFCFIITMNSYAYYEGSINYKNYELKDFEGNLFQLREYNNGGYSIYTADSRFIEGSLTGKSPYYSYANKSLYYLGPGQYFYDYGNMVFNIVENRFENKEIYEGCCFNLNPYNREVYSSSKPDENSTHIDTNNYRVINNDFYFRNLNRVPHNAHAD